MAVTYVGCGSVQFGPAPGVVIVSAIGVRVLGGPLCIAGSGPSDDLFQVRCDVGGLPDVTGQGRQQILDHGRREMLGGELPSERTWSPSSRTAIEESMTILLTPARRAAAISSPVCSRSAPMLTNTASVPRTALARMTGAA